MPTPAEPVEPTGRAPSLRDLVRTCHSHARWLVVGASGALLLACGPASYSIQSARATSAVERARQAEVQAEAPYEFYKAEAHLDKAREEAASAEYEDAIALSKSAAEFAEKAMEIARRKRRSAAQSEASR